MLALILMLRMEAWLSAPTVSGCSASLLQHSLHPRKSLWGPCAPPAGVPVAACSRTEGTAWCLGSAACSPRVGAAGSPLPGAAYSPAGAACSR